SLVKDGDHSRWNFEFPKDQTPFADQNQLSDVVKRLKERGDKFLIWGKPGEKPRIIDIGKFKEEEDDE
ncbi:MAG: hypothetical protein GWN86_00450, partial [Desulfobacterales bacterium]|nr:hypothetical protein [Desulfobacterales bacterium]